MEKQIFQFTNYDVPVEIAGHEFTLNCSTDTGDYLKGAAANLRKIADQITTGEKTGDDALEYGCEIIDHLLGDGASGQILSGRTSKISDVTDVCMFLTEVAAKFRDERQKAQRSK